MNKVRFGIIGIGKMGSQHCMRFTHGLIKNGVLTAVCDIAPERKKWAEEKLTPKGVEFFDDYKALIDSGKVDAVLIATPHYYHPVMAIYALEKGLHTLIEKPAGVYTKAVREMNEVAAAKPELTFGIMYNQRTNKLYRFAKELVETGRLGSMKRINWIITNWYRPQAYYDQGGWRGTWAGEGGGVLINQCPHQLDLFQWLGGMPSSVRAHTEVGKNRNINVENDVTAFMEYENGATGVFITSTGDAHGTNRFEIQLDRAKIVAEEDNLSVLEYEMTEQEFSKTNKIPFGNVPAKNVEIVTDGKNEQHIGVVNAWGKAILNGEPLIADGSEGINGLTLSNAMHLSSWLNKEIDIPFDEELYYNELMKRVATSRRKESGKTVFADTSNTYSGNK